MATTVERVNIITEFNAKGAGRYKQEVGGASKSVSGLGGVVRRVAGPLAALFAAREVIQFGKKIASAAADFEATALSIEIFTGSSEKALALIKELEDFSVRTPFEPEAVINAGKTLLAFGTNAEEVISIINDLGEAAAASGADISNLAFIFGQVRAQGKAQLQDLYQFINAGVPIFELLADSIGTSVGNIRTLTSQGKITGAVLEQAFRKAASEGGKFNGALEAQSQTLKGLGSTISGQLSQITRSIGQLFGPLFKEVATFVRDTLGSSDDGDSFLGKLSAIANSDAPIKLAASFSGVFAFIGASFDNLAKNIEIGFGNISKFIASFEIATGRVASTLGTISNNQGLIELGTSLIENGTERIFVANAKIAASELEIVNAFAVGGNRFKEVFDRLIEQRDKAEKESGSIIPGLDPGELVAAQGSLEALLKQLKEVEDRIAKASPGDATLLTKLNDQAAELDERIRLLKLVIDTLRDPDSAAVLETVDLEELIGDMEKFEASEKERIESLAKFRASEEEKASQDIENKNTQIDLEQERRTRTARKQLLVDLQADENLSFRQRERAYLKFELELNQIAVDAAEKRKAIALEAGDATGFFQAQNDILDLQIQRLDLLQNNFTAFQQAAVDVADFIGNQILPVIDAINQITATLEAAADKAIENQRKRVEDAAKLAEEGNAELLQLEEDRLAEVEAQKRRSAEITRAVAAIEFAANMAIAISNAAAQGGGFGSAALIAVLLASVAGGIAFASQLSQGFYEGIEYVKGPNGRDVIPARLTKGERVVDQKTNAQMKGIPNDELPAAVRMYYAFQNMPVVGESYYDRRNQHASLEGLHDEVAGLREDFQNIKMMMSVDALGLYAGIHNVGNGIQKRKRLFNA